MNREELQDRILDAADGKLSQKEIEELQQRLEQYPGLREDYELLMSTPSPKKAYGDPLELQAFESSIQELKHAVRSNQAEVTFEQVSLKWFWRGALAASLSLFSLTGLYSYQQATGRGQVSYEPIVEENFYPVEESIGETYQIYLDQLSTEE